MSTTKPARRRYAARLEPLTPAAIDRMRDLYASAPLSTTDRTREADLELARKGWAFSDADFEGAMMPTKGAYRMDDGRCVLYDDSGMVHACWRVS